MKLKQKILSVVSAMACAVSFCAGTVEVGAISYSGGIKYGDYLYYKQVDGNNDGTFDYVEILDCEKYAREVFIPTEIEGLPVTSIGEYAFENCRSLISIEIPDSLISIGDIAFCECTSLESAVIPNSVTSIGYCAFGGCTSLTSIEIPDSVTSIGNRAFFCCTNLEKINISENNKNYSIIDGVLFNKNKTTLIAYITGNKSENYKVPDGVKSITSEAFLDCEFLESIEIPNSVTSIESDAFSGCTNLTIYGYYGSYAREYAEKNNIQFIALDEPVVTTPAVTTEITTITTFPPYISGLQYEDFTYTGYYTVYGYCEYIKITRYNKSATKVVIPSKIGEFGTYVKIIGCGAFSDCTNLVSIEIPNSVTLIEDGAFAECPNLTIYGSAGSYAQKYAEGHNINFYDIDNPKPPYSDEMIYEDYLFYKKIDEEPNGIYDYIEITDCAVLATEVIIPDEIDGLPVKTIGNKAFYACKSLLNVEIPENVQSIGVSAFEGCNSLESIKLPNSLITIKSNAFYGCSSLKSIELSENVMSIESSIFSNCTNLEKITILNTECEISSIPKNVVVYGYKNSTAYIYCLKNGISFTALDNSIVTTPAVTTAITDGTTSRVTSASTSKITTKTTTTTKAATTKPTTTSTTKSTTKATTTSKAITTKSTTASTSKTTVKVTTTSKTITTRVTTEDESWRYTTELRTSASNPPPTQTTTTKITTTTNPKPYSDEILYENYLFYKKVDEDRNGTYGCIEISDCAALATTVVIPSDIDNLPVKTVGDKAFYDCRNLLSADIPESVKSIGVSAFEGCSSLESIRLPDGLTTIKSRAFYGCSSLKGIVLPKNVVSIESSMFSGCTCLEKITVLNAKCEISSIPENVIVYGYKNSTAHVYCLKNGISFVALEGSSITTPVVTTSITTNNTTTTSKSTSKNTMAVTKTTTVQTATTTTKNKIPGDANGDGKTTIADIVEMQKYLCKFKTITKEVFKQLDLNNDGKFNVFDWIILKRQIINAAK